MLDIDFEDHHQSLNLLNEYHLTFYLYILYFYQNNIYIYYQNNINENFSISKNIIMRRKRILYQCPNYEKY